MRYRHSYRWSCVAVLAASGALAAPRVYYTDLDSGPNSGGEKNAGAYVTIYGSGFGSVQGSSSVTVGAGRAAAYPIWTDSKIAIQLGPDASTGDIIVTTKDGASNPVPFTVRPGKIYFVASNGKDGHDGSFASPWRTVLKARDSLKPGDIAYLRNGVNQAADDGQGWKTCLLIGANSGTQDRPKSLVAYPGESATLGNVNGTAAGGCDAGIRTRNQGENYWTIAGLKIRGGTEAFNLFGVTGWRLVGNDMSCPNGNGQSACLDTARASNLHIYGNNIHDVATNLDPSKVTALYHGVYLSTDTNHVWFGWNTIANVQGGRGMQVHSSPIQGGGAADPTGHDQYDLHIHDNVIHDTQCDGIILSTVDPSKGPVEIYNNVIYNAGKGPNNLEGSGSWSCINAQAYTNSGPPGSGPIEIYNNTLYACGSFANPPYSDSSAGLMWIAAKNPNKYVHLRRNIIETSGSVPYLRIHDVPANECPDSDKCAGVRGSDNLFYGNGAAPRNPNLKASLSCDPHFVNAAAADFRIPQNGPARNTGAFACASEKQH